jgi:hypothetical protein
VVKIGTEKVVLLLEMLMKLYACAVKNVWHLNVKNARVKSWYYVTRYTVCNLHINGMGLR